MAYIYRTNGTPTSELIWTWSAWVKFSPSTGAMLGWASGASTTPEFSITTAAELQIWTASYGIHLLDNTRKYRDPAAWYHLCVAMDTPQATNTNRVKIWINGVQETTFSTATYPAQNYNTKVNTSGEVIEVGKMGSTQMKGCMSHVHFIDGTAYSASDFGETDATSGIWKIKTSPSVTYGNNGFFLKMEDRTNLDLDSSPNAHTFTTSGTLTPTYDNPSNNFATFNPLTATSAGQDLENGNLYCPGPNSPNYWQSVPATLGARAGKWYWEFKDENSWGSTSDSTRRYGICDLDTIVHTLSSGADVRFSGSTSGYAYMNASGVRYNGGTISGTAANYPTFTDGDIIQVAMDLDNQKLYFGKNGTWLDSSDPTSGATGTGSVADISATATWSPYVEIKYGSDNVSANFGNGYFRTTAVASTNADDAGIGSFEYDVPTGYYALCTKNIKAYG